MKFFYRGGKLCLEVGEVSKRYFSSGHVMAEMSGAKRVLYSCDSAGSVIGLPRSTGLSPLSYTPYGYLGDSPEDDPSIRFKGERHDSSLGAYGLGNGHRFFSVSNARFYSSDTHSPFGLGGLNSYGFPFCDPVNYSDPTGRFGEKFIGFIKRKFSSKPPPHNTRKTISAFEKTQIAYQKTRRDRLADLADGAYKFIEKTAHIGSVNDRILSFVHEEYLDVLPGGSRHRVVYGLYEKSFREKAVAMYAELLEKGSAPSMITTLDDVKPRFRHRFKPGGDMCWMIESQTPFVLTLPEDSRSYYEASLARDLRRVRDHELYGN